MIKLGNKEITAIYLGSKAISMVYRGTVLVWQAVKNCCFNSGRWLNDKLFVNNETWKNN